MSNRADSTPAQNIPWWGRIDTLWLIAPALCTLLYALCLPLAPNDLWYHARAGWYIATHGTLPGTNLFTWGVPPETPYHYQSWIAELLIYLAIAKGLAWAAVLRAVCFGLAISLITAAAYRRAIASGVDAAGAAKGACLGSLLAFLIASNNVDLRPQTFSLILFALWIFLLSEWSFATEKKRSIVGALLILSSLLWANTHGAFPTGLVLLGGIAMGELWTRRSPKLLIIWALCVAAVCCNPKGPGIFAYVASLTTNVIGQRYIQEWQPPRFDEWHAALFLISPIFFVAVAFLNHRKTGSWWLKSVGPGEWLAGIALFLFSLRGARSMVWYALWMGPVLAIFVAQATGAKNSTEPQMDVPRGVQFVNAFLLAMLLILPVPLLPWFKSMLPWPPEFAARFAPTPRKGPNGFANAPDLILESDTPVRAAEYLVTNPAAGRIWNEMVYGSYLLWALHPHQLAYCDPRVELYPNEFWFEYVRLSGGPEDTTQVFERLGVSDVLADVSLQPGLVKRLSREAKWTLIYSNGNSRLFRRKN